MLKLASVYIMVFWQTTDTQARTRMDDLKKMYHWNGKPHQTKWNQCKPNQINGLVHFNYSYQRELGRWWLNDDEVAPNDFQLEELKSYFTYTLCTQNMFGRSQWIWSVFAFDFTAHSHTCISLLRLLWMWIWIWLSLRPLNFSPLSNVFVLADDEIEWEWYSWMLTLTILLRCLWRRLVTAVTFP